MEESDEKTVEREAPEARERYPHFLSVPTRWMDNDVYGHVNNVVYYSYFDTVVNEYLIHSGVLDIEKSPVIGLVVETQCRFFESLAFPDTVHAGLRVARLGAAACGMRSGCSETTMRPPLPRDTSSTSYVERESRKATALPPEMRAALENILAGE